MLAANLAIIYRIFAENSGGVGPQRELLITMYLAVLSKKDIKRFVLTSQGGLVIFLLSYSTNNKFFRITSSV